MKKEEIDLFGWAVSIRSAIRKAKSMGIDCRLAVIEANRPFINRICEICNDAVAKIENEIEKLD